MIGVNESKGSTQIQSAFSIVKQMLSDPQDFDREFRCNENDSFDTSLVESMYPAPEFQVSEEEFASIMRGERQPVRKQAPIVMGLSEPRVIDVEPRPETVCTDYQSRTVDSKGRASVGLHYSPLRTWSDEDSLITYFGILDGLSAKEFAEEQRCDFYTTMIHKATMLFIAEDRSFIAHLKKMCYKPNWLEEEPSGVDMAIVLPSGKRIVFDDF